MAIVPKHGIKLEPHQVVLRPLVTEKTTHVSQRFNAYAFEVAMYATKIDIRNAVQALWGVRVIGMRTQTRVGKPRRTKTVEVQTKPWKRAIVQLHDEDRIAFY